MTHPITTEPIRPCPPSALHPEPSLSLARGTALGSDRGAGPLLADAGAWIVAINGLFMAVFLVWLPLRTADQAQTHLLADLDFGCLHALHGHHDVAGHGGLRGSAPGVGSVGD
jgi:hypothetical protein